MNTTHGPNPKLQPNIRELAKFGPKPKSLEERFWSKTKIGRSGCLEWVGTKNNMGYGMLYDRDTGKKELAHRVAIRLRDGTYPPTPVLHTCDNPSCVLSDHLVVGTQADNMKDKARKGRNTNQYNVVTRQQAERIVTLYDSGYSQCEIAAEVKVHQTTVSRVVRGVVVGLPVISARSLRKMAALREVDTFESPSLVRGEHG